MIFSLQRIEIENFRGVRKPLVIDFTAVPSGLYFVQGQSETGLGSNGAGKSTIFVDAPSWALTGRTARSQRPGADVVNWAGRGKTTRVAVTLSVDGVTYYIVRSRSPNALELDGRKVDQVEIDQLLPLTDAALRRSLLIDQFGEMFLDLRPEAKSQIFTETLGLDKWLLASDRAGKALVGSERLLQQKETEAEATLRAFEEVKTELAEAVAAEESFEAEQDAKLAKAKSRRKEARAASLQCEKALDKARERLAAHSDQDSAVRALEELRSQRRKFPSAIGDAESFVRSCDRELERLDQQLKKYDVAGNTCPECGQMVAVEHIAEKRAELVEQRKHVRAKQRSRCEVLSGLQKQQQDTDLLIEASEAKLVAYREAQSGVSIAAERAIAANREKHQAEQEVTRLSDEENPHTARADRLTSRRKVLRNDLQTVRRAVVEAGCKVEICKFGQRGFREIRLEQIDATLLELEMAANRHGESLGLQDWEIGFATEREKKTGGVSHGFSVFLYPPGEKEPVSWESYSGGESQRWQLSTSFGLAEVLLARSGIVPDFEVLDEPTIHLSQEGIDDLLLCLHDRAHELGRRIFLIDHHSLDRGSFDGVFTVMKDENGTQIEGPGVIKRRERERL